MNILLLNRASVVLIYIHIGLVSFSSKWWIYDFKENFDVDSDLEMPIWYCESYCACDLFGISWLQEEDSKTSIHVPMLKVIERSPWWKGHMDSLDFQFAPLVSTLIATEAILFLAHVVDCTQDIRGSLSVKKIKKMWWMERCKSWGERGVTKRGLNKRNR